MRSNILDLLQLLVEIRVEHVALLLRVGVVEHGQVRRQLLLDFADQLQFAGLVLAQEAGHRINTSDHCQVGKSSLQRQGFRE